MTVMRLVRAGRRQAEALMVDRCRIRPVTGNTTDPGTGAVTPVYGDPVYGAAAGGARCKIQNQRSYPSTPDAGEHKWTIGPTEIHLPIAGTEAVDTGHLVEILSSADPANVGRRFRVRAGDRKSLQTAIRLIVEEVVG